MNILILHSASTKIVKKFCEQNLNEKKYICTFSRNKGLFSEYAEELYLKHEAQRIDGYKVIDELQNYIEKYDIHKVVFMTSNKNGINYENIRIVYDAIQCDNKIILNKQLKCIKETKNFNDYLNEMFYENEDKVLKLYTDNLAHKRIIRKNKKIMFIYDSFSTGGVINLIYEWIKILKDEYEIIFSCYSSGPEIKKFQEIKDIKLLINREDRFECDAELEYYQYLKCEMEKEKPDVVLTSGISTFLPVMLASIETEVPKIYPIANGIWNEVLGSVRIGKYLRYFEQHYDKIIAVSEAVKNSIVKLGIDDNKLEVIYGSSLSMDSIDNIEYNLSKKVITYTGRLSEEKGIEILIEAISKINFEKYSDFEVHIVGDGEEKENLIQLSKKLKLDSVVKFIGYKSNIENILDKSYLLVLSSHTEGLPLCILEAMSHKKMVIATSVGGVPEIVKHNYNGLLINDKDSESLATNIEMCLNNPELVKKMGENGYKTVSEKFDVNVCLENLKKLINND